MTEGMTMETTYMPSAYLAEILRLLKALSEVEDHLNSPALQVKNYEDLYKQEECLKVRCKSINSNRCCLLFLLILSHYIIWGQSSSPVFAPEFCRQVPR